MFEDKVTKRNLVKFLEKYSTVLGGYGGADIIYPEKAEEPTQTDAFGAPIEGGALPDAANPEAIDDKKEDL